MSKDDIVCRCEEITTDEIISAIDDGCDTVTWVKRKTRAGMGLCQGRTCGRLVARLIVQQTGQDPADVLPDTRRPPVRPIPLEILEER
ncbi:MAG: (2Fe-2S)-binding protein [Anaerolineales bacterium]|nr:(2Fe-2S)-binding protein [Anaerolineales bacterium]